MQKSRSLPRKTQTAHVNMATAAHKRRPTVSSQHSCRMTTTSSPSEMTPQERKKMEKAARAAQRGQGGNNKKAAAAAPSHEDLASTASAPLHTSHAIHHTVYSNNRAQEFAQLSEKYPGWKPYSDAITPTHTNKTYCDEYQHIPNGSRLEDNNNIIINTRITSKRTSSSKLVFLDTVSYTSSSLTPSNVQIIASQRRLDDKSLDITHALRPGDWVSFKGFPGKSETGEMSLIAEDITLLTPCLQPLPSTLIDPNIRFRNRSLDLITNRTRVMDIFRIRSQVLHTIRTHLHQRDFIEVETPILWTMAGGAVARPFMTTSNAFGNDLSLSLRIAPELFLKQLVVGGMDRVFEIGKVFRNEGIDATHNPEFSSCELYVAHWNSHNLMTFTEELLRDVVDKVNNGNMIVNIPHHNTVVPATTTTFSTTDVKDAPTLETDTPETDTSQDILIDFSQPFKRLPVIETLASYGIILPDNFNDDESLPILRDICDKHGWVVKAPYTVARYLDKMISEVIEPMCIQPTFIIDHPVALSPLAKQHSKDPRLTERFELFINSKEYANAYSELNIPDEQLERFRGQNRVKLAMAASTAAAAAAAAAETNDTDKTTATVTDTTPGNPAPHPKHNNNNNNNADFIDDEAHPVDTPYCEALQYGLPPTGGWGLGIDRLVMLLAQTPHIREVLLFPIMKPEGNPGQTHH